jgi:CD63 antigen
MIGLGVSSLHGFRYLKLVDTGSFAAPPKLFIAIGVIMFLIAFLGCCGAWMENHSMVMAYSVLVGLILVFQLGVGIAAFLLQDNLENLVQKELNATLINYHNQSGTVRDLDDIRTSWNILQSELKCCGVNGYKDWKASWGPGALPPGETLVPFSCCISTYNNGTATDCAEEITPQNIDSFKVDKIIYTDGCMVKALEEPATTRLGIVAICLGVVQLIGILCACLLAKNIRYSYETV